MFQTATLSQDLNRSGRVSLALPVAKMKSVFVSVGEWRKKGRQAGGSSVGLATYPSSWTGGRVSKWMGGRKVSWHREHSVRRPKKDCDGKRDIRSVVQIFFVRVLFLVWVISCTRRVDVAGEGCEKSAAKNLCENLLVVRNIIHGLKK